MRRKSLKGKKLEIQTECKDIINITLKNTRANRSETIIEEKQNSPDRKK